MSERTIRTHQIKIKAAWQKAVESIIETGQLLIKAKEALEHGEWGKVFEGDDKPPFGRNTAVRLMKIASNPLLSNRDNYHLLPASWQALYSLTQLRPRRKSLPFIYGIPVNGIRRKPEKSTWISR